MAKHKHKGHNMELIIGLLIFWFLASLWTGGIKWIVDKTLYTITGKHHDIWEN